jgi:GNAT superfamily N-acetyltransferase
MNPLALDPARFLVADDEEGGLAAIGQLVPLMSGDGGGGGGDAEVRSLVVSDRLRGRGLGAALLAALVASAPHATRTLWLTTLARRAPFYERAGFAVVAPPGGGRGWLAASLSASEDALPIPRGMRFEVGAGALAAPLLGGDALVVMRRDLQK